MVAERRGVEPHLASSVKILVAVLMTGRRGQSVYRSTDASYRHCLDRIFHSFSSLFITFILFRQKRNASIPVCDNNTDNTCPERNLTERNTHQENYSHRDNHQSENLADVDLQGFLWSIGESNPCSATSVGAAGIAVAATRCLLRLTLSPRFHLR